MKENGSVDKIKCIIKKKNEIKNEEINNFTSFGYSVRKINNNGDVKRSWKAMPRDTALTTHGTTAANKLTYTF